MLDRLRPEAEALAAALRAGDAEAASRLAHQLKGAVGNFDMPDLVARLTRLGQADRVPAAEIAAPMSDAAWLAAAEAAGDEDGYFEALGTNHFALFRDDSPTLLVTFESAAAIRAADAGALPLGHRIAAELDRPSPR